MMAITRPFPFDRLRDLRFSVVYERRTKQILRTFDIEAASRNCYFLLENAKPQDFEFVEFDDQTACVARDGADYVLFGYEFDDLFCVNSDGNISKLLIEQDEFLFVNTDFMSFVRCFSYYQSVILEIRASYLLDEKAVADRERGDLDRYLSILERKQNWLQDSFLEIDRRSLEDGSYWESVLDSFGDDRIELVPRLGYYLRRGRLKIAQD